MYYVLCYYYSVHVMDVNLRDLLVLLWPETPRPDPQLPTSDFRFLNKLLTSGTGWSPNNSEPRNELKD